MKSEDIKTLKELSQETADLMPFGLTADANRRFYMKARIMSTMEMLEMIESSRDRVIKLNAAIQKIEDRKSSRNNTEDSSMDVNKHPPPPPPDPEPDYIKENKPIKP